MKKFILCSSIIGVVAFAAHAQNAQITWQSVQYVSGASDVSTLGTYFGSWSPYIQQHAGALAVNGVTFQGNDLPGFTIDSWFTSQYDGFGNPGTTDANYNTLLQGAQFSNNGTGGSFSWGGLTPGDTYQVQLWAEDTRNIGNRRWENAYEVSYGDSGTSPAITFPADGSSPDLGQYGIGTFVANASGTETISFETWCSVGGNQCAQVNLFQVRDLTAVPEPSTLAGLAAGGLMALLGFRRRK
ncbi:MAG TPA: PEP-CTERM sorting domain-containing protein [Verrucomicrobiae bacterium]|nr:PEP-CTERM sorting domain-containing protein [Verrucomicrobiae bacterium]